MKIQDKINWLMDNHLADWLKTRQLVEDEVSKNAHVFCVCGKLATGLHEQWCKKFRNKVDSETVKKLKHLLKDVKVVCV